MTNEQFKAKFEEIKNNAIAEIVSAIKRKDAPFLHDVKKESIQRAYNASTGLAYEGINSLLIDIKQAEHQYPTNQWLSLDEAQKLGVQEDELAHIRQNWKEEYAEKCIKVHYLQKTKFEPVYKLDEQGQKIPLLDDEGNQRIGKNGKPLFEYDGEVKTNPKTGKTYFEAKMQKVMLENPILHTDLLYNVAEFKSLDKEKIRPLNEEMVKKHLLINLKAQENGQDRTRVFFENLKDQLYPNTIAQIEHYLKAQSFEKDYIAKHTEGIRPQAEKEVNKAIESSKKFKEHAAKYDFENLVKQIELVRQIERYFTEDIKQQAGKEPESKARTNEPKKAKAQAPKAEKPKGRGR